MKINWKVRLKNPYFWIGILGVISTAMGVSPEMFTSWSILYSKIIEMVSNPYMLGSVLMAILGVVCDHTTSGICDSNDALLYENPKK